MSGAWNFEEILALDLLTLSQHTLAAGDQFDASSHAIRLKPSLERSKVICVRRSGKLAAYASLWKKSAELTFVSGFNTHPDYRNGSVLRELMAGVRSALEKHGVKRVQSHVYKTNRRSMAFHQKLGFEITRENHKGVEFGVQAERLFAYGTVNAAQLSRSAK